MQNYHFDIFNNDTVYFDKVINKHSVPGHICRPVHIPFEIGRSARVEFCHFEAV